MRAKAKNRLPPHSTFFCVLLFAASLAVLVLGLRPGRSQQKPPINTRAEQAKLNAALTSSILNDFLWQDDAGGPQSMAKLERLLDRGANPNCTDISGLTALMLAARGGRFRIVEALLNHGADVNTKTRRTTWVEIAGWDGPQTLHTKAGQTALMLASQAGSLECVQALLDAGSDVHTRDEDGYTALLRAAEEGNLPINQLLLSLGSDPKERTGDETTTLRLASQAGDIASMKLFLDSGIAVNAQSKSGVTALESAAATGSSQGVQLLLSKGADVNHQDSDGTTALMIAANSSDAATVKLLLDHGANVRARTREGITALMNAAGTANVGCVQLLIERGADVNARTQAGGTALFRAAGILDGQQSASSVALLLAHGANVKAATGNGETPLLVAVGAGNIASVRLLIEKGADVNAKNQLCECSPEGSVLKQALWKKRPAIIQLLQQSGARE